MINRDGILTVEVESEKINKIGIQKIDPIWSSIICLLEKVS